MAFAQLDWNAALGTLGGLALVVITVGYLFGTFKRGKLEGRLEAMGVLEKERDTYASQAARLEKQLADDQARATAEREAMKAQVKGFQDTVLMMSVAPPAIRELVEKATREITEAIDKSSQHQLDALSRFSEEAKRLREASN